MINLYLIFLKRILLYGAETWTKTKREDSKIQAMEIKFLRAILNKIKERMRNTYIRLEPEVDEINDIQKSRLRWFGHAMRMEEERISRKCYTQKRKENDQEEGPEPDG